MTGVARTRLAASAPMILTVCLVAIVYWPLRHAGFVWDDKIAFQDSAWLRHGADSWSYIVHGISGSSNYFRPLVVALFLAEVRASDVTPAPMHMVSLAIHLFDTALVALLARRLLREGRGDAAVGPCVAAALFGLHPAQVEPVSWIASQSDLLVTMFGLIALYANAAVRSTPLRAAALALCFFLAACAKESAASIPLLVILFDLAADGSVHWRNAVLTTWRRQRFVYAGMVAAGMVYLVLRDAALGHLLQQIGSGDLFSLEHFQKVCATFVSYWRVAVWPMAGLGPLHEVPESTFSQITALSAATDAVAVTVAAASVVLFARRVALGALMLTFGAALLPVLNLVPTLFVESLYHERYLMLALAVACAWLPRTIAELPWPHRRTRLVGGAVAASWLALAVFNVRVTLPLWADEVLLWQWAARQDPASITVKDHLLSEYIARNDIVHVRALSRELLEEDNACSNCLLNVAYAMLAEGDGDVAARALERLKSHRDLALDPRLLHGYILANGQLSELRGDAAAAQDAYHDAATLDPLDPMPHFQLALALATQGKTDAARSEADTAIEMFAPDQRAQRRRQLDQAIARGLQAAPNPSAR